MKLDKFISNSLKSILQGMREFDKSEEDLGKMGAVSNSPAGIVETATVFPQLSAASKDLASTNLMKSAPIKGSDGYATIMSIDFDVQVTVTDDVMGVAEGSAGITGFAKFKAKVQGKSISGNSHRLNFSIPLELPLPTRSAKPPAKKRVQRKNWVTGT